MSIARPVDRRLFMLLERARHKLFKRANGQMQEQVGITAAQGGALFFLYRHRDCLLSDMAEGLSLNNSAITGLAARMETAGLIVRHKSRADGRAVRVRLTETGREKALAVQEYLRELNQDIASGFSDDEMDVVYRFLFQLAEVRETL